MNVLVITSEWPTPEHPEWVPFIVHQVESLQGAGIDVDVFHFRGARNPLNYYYAHRRVHHLLAEHAYDLVHSHFGQAAIPALFPKVLPLVVTYHGSDLEGIVNNRGHYTLEGQILRTVSRLVAKFADEIIVVSESLLKYLGHSDCHVIPCGINLDLFHPIPKDEARLHLFLPLDETFILFVGDPTNPVKRYHLAEQVVSEVNQYKKSKLLVANGEPHAYMPYFMNAADALLLTSLHEGSPTVVKEAMACNLPIVTIDVGDVRQRLGKVEGSAVCSDDSPLTLAIALVGVLNKRSGVNSRSWVADLDEVKVADDVIEVYRRALARKH